MNRQEAAEVLTALKQSLEMSDDYDYCYYSRDIDAYDTALTALRGHQPDPITGLMPCGCGGKATRSYSSIGCVVFCASCGLSTKNIFFASEAVNAWNVAMGYKGGAE
jgi:hypothetical protein